jgi:VWFA-related protein
MRLVKLRLGRLVGAAVCVGACLSAGANAQQYSDVTEVLVVEVPVQVVRDGEPVRGLTAADFEVYDGRKKQQVTGFEVLDLYAPGGAPARAAEPVPASARRHFLLLFDLSFSEPKSILKARDAAKGVVDRLHPTDLVGVATYSASKGPQLALGFTTDRRQVALAVDTLGVPELIDRSPDPLKLVLAETRAEITGSRLSSGGGGINADARSGFRADTQEALLDWLESAFAVSNQANRANQGAAVTALTRSFADLAKLMGGVEGRKHVVYLSEGFDSSLVMGTADQARQQEMNQAAESGEYWNVDSEERFGSTQASNDVEKMLEEFRRADCVIQAVDIGGLKAGGDQGAQRTGGRDSLFTMAKSTGGELYENFNDLGAAMDQMLKRTGVTYVLTFQPEKVKSDGSYRRLRVELKNAPRGTRVVYRSGYYAPRAYAQQNPLEKLLDAANQLTSGEESGTVAASVLAAPFRVSGEKAYVPVLIDVDGPTLLAGKQAPTLPAEIYVYALDSTGAVHDFISQTLGLDLGKAEALLRQGGLRFFGHLDLLPGEYSLRVMVRNGTTGALAVRVLPVTVPQFAQAGPVLLPPFFPDTSNRWLVARETQDPAEPQVDYPFMARDQAYVPASKPVLALGKDVPLALVGYNLGAGDLKAEAKVFTRDGQEVGAVPLTVLSREGGGGAPDRLTASFRPPSLQPGEYVLRVTVTGPAGAAGTSSTPFVVGKGAAG